VIERFDLRKDGTWLGFEDFCVLNALHTTDKYKGGYETRLFKRAREFIAAEHRRQALHDLFKLLVLNCAIRNGDAHLPRASTKTSAKE
jgi:serine/threonine-protein kinase HipA